MHLFVFIVFLHGITSKSEALDDSYMNCSYNEEQIQKDLRIMTFNIWMSGSNVVNGINKIARHINTINPDVVCLQEVNDDNTLAKIVEAAGKQWKGNFNLSTNNAIMAKNSNVKNEFSTDMVTGVTITNQSGHSIRVVSAHLEYTLYGPYVAMNKLVKERSRLMTAENDRVDNINKLLMVSKFQKWIKESDKIPLFVCGDFNTPSHLDWGKKVEKRHGDWIFNWPATKLLQNKTGLSDAYRTRYPDPEKYPGITWSTVIKFYENFVNIIPEPEDRIDFIFFDESLLNVVNAFTYCGNSTIRTQPYHDLTKNDYPSDHYVVVADFKFK